MHLQLLFHRPSPPGAWCSRAHLTLIVGHRGVEGALRGHLLGHGDRAPLGCRHRGRGGTSQVRTKNGGRDETYIEHVRRGGGGGAGERIGAIGSPGRNAPRPLMMNCPHRLRRSPTAIFGPGARAGMLLMLLPEISRPKPMLLMSVGVAGDERQGGAARQSRRGSIGGFATLAR